MGNMEYLFTAITPRFTQTQSGSTRYNGLLFMDQIELFNHLLYLTACKQMSSDSFKNNVNYKLFTYKSYIYIYMYK